MVVFGLGLADKVGDGIVTVNDAFNEVEKSQYPKDPFGVLAQIVSRLWESEGNTTHRLVCVR